MSGSPMNVLLASQDPELVPQQHDFQLLGELDPPTPNEQPQKSGERDVSERDKHAPIVPRPSEYPHDSHSSACAAQRFLLLARAREPS
jgi:hypothetical protein